MAVHELDLTGKVAVVTGGSRGIGAAIIRGYAEAGADVVIASRKLSNCEALAAEIGRATGRRPLAVSFHAARWDDCDRLVDKVYDHFGRCDVFVNNAGMSPLYPDPRVHHRGLLRQGRRREPEGTVPPGRVGRGRGWRPATEARSST